jgi:ADP-ribose pyrophosphatase
MTKEIKLLTKETIYEGYLRVYKYNLEIPSLDSSHKSISFKERELVHSRDSVLVLIYAPMLDSFVLCKEFRIGVFCNTSRDDPFILECVSGTIDKNASPEETALKETYEETGLKIDGVELIATVYKTPGLMTEKTYIYYVEYAGTPEEGLYGLEEEGEEILTQVLAREQVYSLMDAMKINDAATLIALNWFRAKRA